MADGAALICAGNNLFIERLKGELAKVFDSKDIVPVNLEVFPNREVYAQLQENVRRRVAFIFWNFEGYDGSFEPNVGFEWLHVLNDATRRASASEINDMLPFIPYLRQDRKDKPRVPITARLKARHIESDGVSRIVTVEPHTEQVQGFYDIPVDLLPFYPLFEQEIFKGGCDERYVLVAPDVGAVKRTRSFQKWIRRKRNCDIPMVIIDKGRDEKGEPSVYELIGNPRYLEGATAILFDDMIDTGGSLVEGGQFLKEHYGASRFKACAPHGLFSQKPGKQPAEERLRGLGMEVITTDSIPRTEDYARANEGWLKIVSLAPLFAEAARNVYAGRSISAMEGYV